MATSILIHDGEKPNCPNLSCSIAAQCCWYETHTEVDKACSNRNTLICQKRRDEVFGHNESTIYTHLSRE